jgi:hypothetical protein
MLAERETITPIGLPSVRNNELLFKLDDVMAGIGIECKQNLAAGTPGWKSAYLMKPDELIICGC